MHFKEYITTFKKIKEKFLFFLIIFHINLFFFLIAKILALLG
ncbi:hypothetical protein HMPREF9093_00223 [Fusobacterium sp. oral taxon 370 str. F0437]|nr:hypothetical protein HMPREF9093_00223 [Fusobacterium sp. oral taxon 370 str. F0437]